MYRVTIDDQVLEQVAALPIEALASYAELLVVLETVPWNGVPFTRTMGPVAEERCRGVVWARVPAFPLRPHGFRIRVAGCRWLPASFHTPVDRAARRRANRPGT